MMSLRIDMCQILHIQLLGGGLVKTDTAIGNPGHAKYCTSISFINTKFEFPG